jgi:N-acetylmuramoyl-L-alanine amidase
MKIKKIMVDPGHGGTDPGAVNMALGLKESDIALAIADSFEAQAADIRVAFEPLEVKLTRVSDIFVSLQDRVCRANVSGLMGGTKVDLFLSFHINAEENPKPGHQARGFEIWTSIGDTPADKAATAIFNSLKAAMPDTPARADYDDGDPDKESNFYVLRNTLMPAVLIEFEFITNDERARFLADPTNQAALAGAVLNAVTSLAD